MARDDSMASLFKGWDPHLPGGGSGRPRGAPARGGSREETTRPGCDAPLPETRLARPGDEHPATPESALQFSVKSDTSDPAPGTGPCSGGQGAGPAAPRALRPPPGAFPRPGQVLHRFRILGELGRGAFARVYLAEQIDLADRPVAIKVSEPRGDEPQNLARLQHTNIVPIHSVHLDARTGLRVLCMPYVGGANLAQILSAAGARLPSQVTGRSLIEALDRVRHTPTVVGWPEEDLDRRLRRPEVPASGVEARGARSTVRSGVGRYFSRVSRWRELEDGVDPLGEGRARCLDVEPARRFLRNATYVQAAIWIGARLAEALDHAHQRGILHRDLKPSNVLIAADGTPMLLDFNLSVRPAPDSDGDPGRTALGGTLPYMAPEHLDAMCPRGRTRAAEVGVAADIYSLGLIVFEIVTGAHPFDDPPPGTRLEDAIPPMIRERVEGPPSARAFHPGVPWALDAVLAKCLDPEPGRRYPAASDLAADLQNLLDDRGPRHARDPSPREAFARWRRRHPRATSSTMIGALALGLLVATAAVAFWLSGHLAASNAQLTFAEFERQYREAQLRLNTTFGPIAHLTQGVALADAALAEYGVGRVPDWLDGDLVRRLGVLPRRQLLQRLSDLVQLRARAVVELAQRSSSEPRRRRALQEAVAWLDRAEAFDSSPSFALYDDRQRYLLALGESRRAEADRAKRRGLEPRTARDFTLLGTGELARGRLESSEGHLSRAVAIDPRWFWGWFALGLCHHEQGRLAEAAADFAVATALEPQFAWPHLNRGLALAAAGRLVEARSAYDRALECSPDFIEGRVNRALACLELGDAATALSDLERALALGCRYPEALIARAEALGRLGRAAEAAQGFEAALARRPDDPSWLVARGFYRLDRDRSAARADFERALAADPGQARARLGLAHVLREHDPHAALAELDRALRDDPGLFNALELRALLRGRIGDPEVEGDVDRLEARPTPHHLYNAACALALAYGRTGQEHHARRALALLGRAVAAGFPVAVARADPDLAAIAGRPGFKDLLAPPRGPASR